MGRASAVTAAARFAGRLTALAEAVEVLTEERLAEVADRIHPVFQAAAQPSDRARLITEILAETGVRPALHVAGADCPHPTWLVEQSRMVVLASAAVALRDYLGRHGMGRIGVCAGKRCADVYIDASPTGRRRFCSVTCQNRTRVAAFRRRKGESGTAQDP